MSTILEKIVIDVRASLEARKVRKPYADLEREARDARKPHAFGQLFDGQASGAPRVIAEVKFSSPSRKFALHAGAHDPVAIASGYLSRGASAISVLTEEKHFQGSPAYLSAVRARFPRAHLLMKDFVVEEYQILEGLLLGADAVLLMVSVLGDKRLKVLQQFCTQIGIAALVEVHDEAELAVAQAAGASLIGVNNRDLHTLETSLDTSFRLARLVSRDVRLLSESGIKTGSEIRELRSAGFDGFLIGTSFMKTADPGEALAALLKEAEAP